MAEKGLVSPSRACFFPLCRLWESGRPNACRSREEGRCYGLLANRLVSVSFTGYRHKMSASLALSLSLVGGRAGDGWMLQTRASPKGGGNCRRTKRGREGEGSWPGQVRLTGDGLGVGLQLDE